MIIRVKRQFVGLEKSFSIWKLYKKNKNYTKRKSQVMRSTNVLKN